MDPGASYECPLVLETSPPNAKPPFAPTGKKRSTPVICIDNSDDEEEEDRKIAANPTRPTKRARTPQLLNPPGPTTLVRRPWRASSSSSAVASLNDSDSDQREEDPDAALARQLQEEEWASRARQRNRGEEMGSPMSVDGEEDPTLTALLKAEREFGKEDDDLNQLSMQSDASLAAQLHQQEQEKKERRMKEEHQAMSKSLDGRAWLFVNQVLDLHKRLSPTAPGPETVAVDDMVFLGKNFLQCMEDFQQKGLPARVTLAYHYTRSERMDSIKQDGLMTLADRKKAYNNSHGVGVFGDGIYTATNPFGFRHFGDCGLLVAVLLGNTTRVTYDGKATKPLAGINTKIGNKRLYRGSDAITDEVKYTDELVLQESRQCFPLVKFKTASVSSEAGKDAVWMFHQELQRLLDSTFNKNVRTKLNRVHESTSDPYRTGGSAAARSATLLAASRALTAASQARTASNAAASLASIAGMGFPVGSTGPSPANLFAGVFGPPGAALPSLPSLTSAAGTALPSLPPHMMANPSFAPGANPFNPPAARRARRSTRNSPSAARSASGRSTRTTSNEEVIQYTAPPTLSAASITDAFVKCKKESKEDCVICMESLSGGGRAVRLRDCGHEYHKQCIKGALKSSNKCPVCRALISKPQGHCPSGTMRISTSRSIRCGGFENCGSIIITYEIPSGTQLPYHENPGERYHGATRIAYLPDNDDGRKLLGRLKFAWNHGMMFTVGTSLTTRQPNCVTWASIHHKTSPHGGQHGFPDPGFFLNCNGELDSAGVPK